MKTNDDNQQVWREIIVKSITLFKRQGQSLQNYLRQNERNRKNIVLFLMARRIVTNMRAIAELAGVSYMNNGTLLFKFPIGLLLRNCFSDSITGLYLMKQDDVTFNLTMELWNRDYTNALLEEFEVYKDKINDLEIDDNLVKHLYSLELEDTFLNYLELKNNYEDVLAQEDSYIWKARNRKEYLPEGTNELPNIKRMADTLIMDSQFAKCTKCLYAYYKYFSQWEHFSENGAGDILADYGEDNIKISMAFGHINTALDFILKNNNASTE